MEKTENIVKQIRDLENGYCNPMKFKFAEELKEDLYDRGYTKHEIEEMLNDD
jgi:hypothetical protein